MIVADERMHHAAHMLVKKKRRVFLTNDSSCWAISHWTACDGLRSSWDKFEAPCKGAIFHSCVRSEQPSGGGALNAHRRCKHLPLHPNNTPESINTQHRIILQRAATSNIQ